MIGDRYQVLILAAAMALSPMGALAENTGLDALTRRDQLLGWEAVGRIDLGGSSFCTGVLIATDLVLTAAHCVYDRDGAPVDPGQITFRAGYSDGVSVAEAAVQTSLAHPAYDPMSPVSSQNVRHDVALLRLAQPIASAVAAPFTVHAPGKGDAISVVSYARGREEVLSWQRECAVLDRAGGLIAMNCNVTFGSSGAPVFDRSGARARIVSIVSAGGPTDDGVVAYGMELPKVVAELKALLLAGKSLAVATATAPTVPLLGSADGSSRDIGARFVKP